MPGGDEQGTARDLPDHRGPAGGLYWPAPGDRLLGGGQGETHTIVPIVEAFRTRHHVEDMVVVANVGYCLDQTAL